METTSSVSAKGLVYPPASPSGSFRGNNYIIKLIEIDQCCIKGLLQCH